MSALPKEEELNVAGDPEGEEMLAIIEAESDTDEPVPELDGMEDPDEPEEDEDVEIEDVAIPEEEDDDAEAEIARILAADNEKEDGSNG